ncbi:MAG: phosphate acyltransferase, partial [Candidatus Delongbacteria bacterium]
GEPDILLMPNLEAANILTKAYKFHAQANSGGLVMGAKVPVVLNSRSDDAERRLNSLMMAMAIDSVMKNS